MSSIVTASDVLAVIDRFLSGGMTAVELEAWASRREATDDFDFDEEDRVPVIEALFMLAIPEINGALTNSHVEEVRAALLQGRSA